jgi:hypothetical protein
VHRAGPGEVFSQVFFYSMKGENADVQEES